MLSFVTCQDFYSSQVQVLGPCLSGFNQYLQFVTTAVFSISLFVTVFLMRNVEEKLLIKVDMLIAAIVAGLYVITVSSLFFKSTGKLEPLVRNSINSN